MPGSCNLLDDWFGEILGRYGPFRSAWDIGSGTGKRGAQLRAANPECFVRGSDPGYNGNLEAPDHYSTTDGSSIDRLIATRHFEQEPIGIIVFGDVLEHLPLSGAVSAVHWAAYNARYIAAIWPTGYVQGPCGPCGAAEVHVSQPSPWELSSMGTIMVLEYRRIDANIDRQICTYHGLLLKGLR